MVASLESPLGALSSTWDVPSARLPNRQRTFSWSLLDGYLGRTYSRLRVLGKLLTNNTGHLSSVLLPKPSPSYSGLALTKPRVPLVQTRCHEHCDKDHEPREGQPTDDPRLVEVDDRGRGLNGGRTKVDRGYEDGA